MAMKRIVFSISSQPPPRVTSIFRISKTLGNLNHRVGQVHHLKDRALDVQQNIITLKNKQNQIQRIIHAQQSHLQKLLQENPSWMDEYMICSEYEKESVQPTHIAPSSIAIFMNIMYELSRRCHELEELEHMIEDHDRMYHHIVADIQHHQNFIRSCIKDSEPEAKFFGIPYNFHRCHQVLQEFSPSIDPS